MKAFLTVKKQGDILVAQKSRSFVIGFCGLMARQWTGESDTLNDTGGNSQATDESAAVFLCAAQGGYGLARKESTTATGYMESDRLGIVIGSGTGTVAPSDYSLGTQLRSGEKTGTILYLGTAVYGLTVDSGTDTGSFKILGLFHNVSGGSIDVKEVGVYAAGDTGVQSHPNIFGYCILRDNITTISLADEEFLEVEYTSSIAT